MPETVGRSRGVVFHVLPLILYCGALFVVSSMPQPPMSELVFKWGDKVTHGVAFLGMAILAWHAARKLFPNLSRRLHLAVGALFASLYGATDELHQYFVPGRTSDIYDWIADTAGALLAVLILALVLRFRRKKSSDPT